MQTNKYRQIFKLVSESFIKSDVKQTLIYRPQRYLTTTSRLATTSNDGRLEFSGGRAKLIVKLPARGEYCEFNLKLINQTVGDLTEQIKHEDKSIEKVLFYSTDGVRLAQNTSLGILVSRPFQLKINELTYNVESPQELVKQSEIDLELEKQSKSDLEHVKQLVSKLYLHLNIEQYEQEREQFILKQLEALKSEIEPMERVKEELALKAKRHTNRMVWLGLGAMSIQMGILARLTWFDYSWDIVEPISYFVSYSAVIGVYAYFVLTRKEYDYESASDRIFLRYFHKNASKSKLDVNRYNEIKGRIFSLESDLDRIKEAHLKNFEKHVQKN